MPRIILADDHAILRQSLKALLSGYSGIDIIGEASDGFEALELTRKLRPDILVVDISMPRLNGLDVTQRVKHEKSCPHVIVLSMRKGQPYIKKAFKYGADAYVLKSASQQDLFDAIEAVSQGELYLSPKIAQMAVMAFISDSKSTTLDVYDTLTAREKEIFQLSAEGFSYKKIAEFLTISEHTVITHRRNIFKKLQLKNQGDLIRFALDQGIISQDG